MLNRCLVSVVIPVYNVSDYLERCLHSVVNQSYRNLEIILVDDGSTDNSSIICDRYAKKDRRITVFHQSNQGVSAARNIALNEASGDFVVFVDSDDFLFPDSISNRLKAMNEAYDLVMGRIQRVDETGAIIDESRFEKQPTVNKIAFLEELFNEEACGYQGFLFDKMFRAQIIKENSIIFNTKVKINEDRLFVFEYALYCNRVKYIPEILYVYCQRAESATAKIKATVSSAELSAVLSFIEMRQLSQKSAPQIYHVLCTRSFECGLALYKRTNRENSEVRKKLRTFMKDSLISCLFCRQITSKRKCKLLAHYFLKV